MNTIAYFSYTGNTRYLAKKLQSYLGDSTTELFDIAFDEVDIITPGDHLVIMFAIHAFNPPTQVIEFVNNLQPDLYKMVHFIGVGCNELWVNDGASDQLNNSLKRKGYGVGVNRVLAMPLTLIKKMPQDTGMAVVESSLEKLQTISCEILNGSIDELVISNKVKAMNAIGKLEKHAAKLFGLELHANENCISCGICERECPMKNIKLNDQLKPKFGFNCSMCLKCIYDCPKNAINPRVSKFISVKGGYDLKEYLK